MALYLSVIPLGRYYLCGVAVFRDVCVELQRLADPGALGVPISNSRKHPPVAASRLLL